MYEVIETSITAATAHHFAAILLFHFYIRLDFAKHFECVYHTVLSAAEDLVIEGIIFYLN